MAFGVICVLLGLGVGLWWPPVTTASVWSAGPPAVTPIATPVAGFADIVASARPSIVSVRARVVGRSATLPVDAAATVDGESAVRNGSGFVVHADGLVVTSRHLVADAESIEVLVPHHGRLAAVLVGEDVAVDLALLRLEGAPSGLPTLPLGDSEDLRAGDWIVAVGNPYGFSQTVTAGVVSFVGRHLRHGDLAVTSDFVQISAPVNPGSSGGPVLGLDGRVVGVTTKAAVAAQGISFAVPSRTLKWTLDAMNRSVDGQVRRGYLGVELATWNAPGDAVAPRAGAVLVGVVDDGPAATAGLRRGDVVLTVDGFDVADAETLHERIVNGAPGSRLVMRILRDDHIHASITATLSEMAAIQAPLTWN